MYPLICYHYYHTQRLQIPPPPPPDENKIKFWTNIDMFLKRFGEHHNQPIWF